MSSVPPKLLPQLIVQHFFLIVTITAGNYLITAGVKVDINLPAGHDWPIAPEEILNAACNGGGSYLPAHDGHPCGRARPRVQPPNRDQPAKSTLKQHHIPIA